MTILGILALLGIFIWGIVLSQRMGGELGAVLLLVALGVGGIWFIYCWGQYVLAIALIGFMGFAMLRTLAALLSAGGGQLLKAIMVIGACVVALPPFWPTAIPLLVCLVGLNLLLAPISLLVGTVRNFMDR